MMCARELCIHKILRWVEQATFEPFEESWDFLSKYEHTKLGKSKKNTLFFIVLWKM